MDHNSPADWVYVLALIQLFGLKYMMAATDGFHLGVDILPRKRWLALGAGIGLIWIPFITLWVMKGFGPATMWSAASTWWNSETGPFGYVLAIAEWWLLLTPLQAIIAIILTVRATRRYNEAMAMYSLPY